MRAGPKPEVKARQLDLRRLPPAGGARVVAFVEEYLRVPKGTGARQKLRLRPWQREIVCGLFDEPRPRYGLLSIPRANGKTTLAACLGLYGLFADGVEGAQVISVASDERQARILFNIARRMVELEPRLARRCQIFQDRLYVPHTDSSLFALPAEAGALQGFDPSLAVVDELAFVTDAVWEAIALSAGKRERSLTLAISTPAADPASVMWRLVELGRSRRDPSFYFKEFAAREGCALDDEEAWKAANPALDDFQHRDALRAALRTSRESAFRRFRLGQWVPPEEAWLPAGAWEACSTGAPVPEGAEVVIALDGSFNGDCTALVVATCGSRPHLDVLGLWERPEHLGPEDWRVPVLDVEEAIRQACRRFQVRQIVADPFRWTRSLQVLEEEGFPVLEFPQSPQRMIPATTRFQEAVLNRELSHSGDPRLARHVANAVLHVGTRGPRLRKEHKHSRRHIDLAVAAVMAVDQATAPAPAPSRTPVRLLSLEDDVGWEDLGG